jgi:transcriptional regulator with XRE-family HTH domain
MDQRSEAAEFLRTRRDRLTPDMAGIIGGTRRRVPGLRREEVAMLAGVSVEYYARMERGDLRGVSPEVVESLARALHLDEAETAHLHDLVASAGPQAGRRRGRPAASTVRPSLQRFLDAVTGAPVWVRDRRMNYVAANALGRALYSPVLDDPSNGANTARFTFLNPAARLFFPNWENDSAAMVATLRTYAGQNPRDKALTDLIGELVTRSDTFRHRWAAHDVRFHRNGRKRIHHPAVGDLELCYEAMDLPDHPEWFMFAYVPAEPGGPTDDRLRLLGSLAVTPDPSTSERHH